MPAESTPDRRSSCLRLLSLLLLNSLWLAPALLLAPATSALAQDSFVVTSTADDSGVALATAQTNCPIGGGGTSCTLRDAVTAASVDTNPTAITFTVTGKIVISSTSLLLKPVALMTITGPGENALTVSGNNAIAVMEIASGSVTIAELTIASGNGGASSAGGIQNLSTAGTLSLSVVAFVSNTTASATGGAAIYNTGTLNVQYSSFTGNSATASAAPGGAIENASGGKLAVITTTFSGNSSFTGAAIENDSANALVVTNSTFSANTAASAGSAIDCHNGAPLTVYNSTFASDAKSGIAYTGTALNIYNSLLVQSTECSVSGGAACPTTGANGNVVAPAASKTGQPALLPIGNYGGFNLTYLPPPGSSVLCAGLAADLPAGLATDQRFFPLNKSCVDPGAVQSNYITVTSSADDFTAGTAAGTASNCPGTACTLRDALTVAANRGDIDFASGVSTILFGAEGPATLDDINIIGPGAAALTVSGQNANVMLGTFGGNAYLSGMTFANGFNNSDTTGGAIFNMANLTVVDMAFTGNTAVGYGGAIYNDAGTVTAINCTFTNNSAPYGSAIFNNSHTTGVTLEYTTVANNNASGAGALFSDYGGAMNIYNSTFSGNINGGIAYGDSTALTIENSLFSDSTQCAASGGAVCPPTGTLGNVVDPTNETAGMPALSALGFYNGTNSLYSTQTFLPEPGSSAICAGSAALIPAGLTTDQRGFPITNTSYAGYSSAAPCVDAGAVQTNYTSAQFVGTAPYVAAPNTPGSTPPVILAITENQQNIGGIPVTLSFSGTGTASGLTATTVEGAGATFSAIDVTAASGASYDTLSASIPVVGDNTLTAGPVNLQVATPKTTPTVSLWPTASAITYGQMLSAATLSPGAASVAGTFAFTSPSTIPTAGTALQSVTFTPTNTTLYNTVTGSVSVTVNKATPTITWTTPPAVTYGTAVSSSQLDATANVPGVFVYSSLSGTVLTAGSQTLSVTFTPTDTTDYNTVTAKVPLTINKATPTVTWASPAAITYGTALSSTQLDATASVAGSFLYSPAAGNVPAEGSDTLSVTFTPTDTTDYNTATAQVTLTVNYPSTPIVSYIEVNGGAWQTTAAVTVNVGDTVNLGPQPLTGGSWSWTGPGGYTSTARQINSIPLTAPTNVFTATYTNQYGVKSTQAFTISIAATPITPYIQVNNGAWQTAAAATVNFGDAVNLGPQPLTGGSWSWTGPGGYTSTARQINSIPLSVGTNTYVATYTNADGVKSTQTFTITVNATTVTMGVASQTQTYQTWTNFVIGPTYTGSRVPTGTVTLYDNSKAVVTLTLGGNGLAYYTAQPFSVGANNLTATYSGDAYFPAGTSAVVTITVLPAPVNFFAACYGGTLPTSPYYCIVSVSASTSTQPSGNITWSLDGASPVSVSLTSGIAIFTIPVTFTPGTHRVTLSYAAQGNFAAGGPIVESFTTQ